MTVDFPSLKKMCYTLTRTLFQLPHKAEVLAFHREGEGVADAQGLRKWVYGRRCGLWCWIQTVTKTGKHLGAVR